MEPRVSWWEEAAEVLSEAELGAGHWRRVCAWEWAWWQWGDAVEDG